MVFQSVRQFFNRVNYWDTTANQSVGLAMHRQPGSAKWLSTHQTPDEVAQAYSLPAPFGVGSGQPVTPKSPVAPPASKSSPPRRVYVLHSGMNDPNSEAVRSLQQGLLQRGIPAEDIIVLDNPYPSFSDGVEAVNRNWNLYRDSTILNSPVTQQAYSRLERALASRGISNQDQIVWVGHSAGGQMGLTLSRMAHNRGNFRFHSVVTLGSPIASNPAPEYVQVRQYVSPGDWVLLATNQVNMDGVHVDAVASNLDQNDQVRVFSNVGHTQWTRNNNVVDRIVQEGNPSAPPRQWSSWFMQGVAYVCRNLFGMTLEPS